MKMKKILLVMTLVLLPAGGQHLMAQEGTLIDGVAAIVGKNIVKYSDVERSLAPIRMHSSVTDAHAPRCAIVEPLIPT